jgi:hypothetical protein
MMDIDILLERIQRTNKDMTRERLIEELKVCRYSTVGLLMCFENFEKISEKNF